MQIYRTGNRMFMIIEVGEHYDPVQKAKSDANDSKVIEWELLMSKFQKPLPWAAEGEKWVAMHKILQL